MTNYQVSKTYIAPVGGFASHYLYLGTPGDDSITGTTGSDVIFTGGGKDTVHAGLGDDTIVGQAAYNILDGGGGNDVIVGSASINTITGGAGNDTIFAGGVGIDKADGGTGNDVLDILGNTSQQIALFGGDGNDTMHYHVGPVATLDAGAGNDLITIDFGQYHVGGPVPPHADIAAFGGSGNDTFTGAAADGNLHGGAGNDVFLFYNDQSVPQNNAIDISGDGGNDYIQVGYSLAFNLLNGGDGDDTIIGSGNSESIFGGSGNDLISSGTHNHALVDGGSGNDTITVNPSGTAHGTAVIEGGSGNDIINIGTTSNQPTIDTLFYTSRDTGTDTVTGFHNSEDHLVLALNHSGYTNASYVQHLLDIAKYNADGSADLKINSGTAIHFDHLDAHLTSANITIVDPQTTVGQVGY